MTYSDESSGNQTLNMQNDQLNRTTNEKTFYIIIIVGSLLYIVCVAVVWFFWASRNRRDMNVDHHRPPGRKTPSTNNDHAHPEVNDKRVAATNNSNTAAQIRTGSNGNSRLTWDYRAASMKGRSMHSRVEDALCLPIYIKSNTSNNAHEAPCIEHKHGLHDVETCPTFENDQEAHHDPSISSSSIPLPVKIIADDTASTIEVDIGGEVAPVANRTVSPIYTDDSKKVQIMSTPSKEKLQCTDNTKAKEILLLKSSTKRRVTFKVDVEQKYLSKESSPTHSTQTPLNATSFDIASSEVKSVVEDNGTGADDSLEHMGCSIADKEAGLEVEEHSPKRGNRTLSTCKSAGKDDGIVRGKPTGAATEAEFNVGKASSKSVNRTSTNSESVAKDGTVMEESLDHTDCSAAVTEEESKVEEQATESVHRSPRGAQFMVGTGGEGRQECVSWSTTAKQAERKVGIGHPTTKKDVPVEAESTAKQSSTKSPMESLGAAAGKHYVSAVASENGSEVKRINPPITIGSAHKAIKVKRNYNRPPGEGSKLHSQPSLSSLPNHEEKLDSKDALRPGETPMSPVKSAASSLLKSPFEKLEECPPHELASVFERKVAPRNKSSVTPQHPLSITFDLKPRRNEWECTRQESTSMTASLSSVSADGAQSSQTSLSDTASGSVRASRKNVSIGHNAPLVKSSSSPSARHFGRTFSRSTDMRRLPWTNESEFGSRCETKATKTENFSAYNEPSVSLDNTSISSNSRVLHLESDYDMMSNRSFSSVSSRSISSQRGGGWDLNTFGEEGNWNDVSCGIMKQHDSEKRKTSTPRRQYVSSSINESRWTSTRTNNGKNSRQSPDERVAPYGNEHHHHRVDANDNDNDNDDCTTLSVMYSRLMAGFDRVEQEIVAAGGGDKCMHEHKTENLIRIFEEVSHPRGRGVDEHQRKDKTFLDGGLTADSADDVMKGGVLEKVAFFEKSRH